MIRKLIPGQISGYWCAPWDDLLEERPGYGPQRAVLPSHAAFQGPHSTARLYLDVVLLNGVWRPLSEAGALTFAHSEGIACGEAWRFVHFGRNGRSVYEATQGPPITFTEMAEYGPHALLRCSPERRYVQLRLVRDPGS